MDTQHPIDTQTPAQWAVRWFGVVAVLGVLAFVPLWHLVWHVALGRERPIYETRSQIAAPPATVAALRDGSWMIREERYLREASPLTWWLRGSLNESLYRLGVPQSRQVHFGKDEWFFDAGAVAPDVAAFDRAAPNRQRFLREVRDLVRAAGAELFVVVEPDKARVYPDKAYADGVLPAAKAPIYGRILAELADAGIATVDVAAAMAAARAAAPDEELYFRRDTHWRPAGALAAGRAVAAALEQRFGERLGPRLAIELGNQTSVRAIGDLTANCGLATVECDDPVIGRRTVAMSLLSEQLAEVRDYYGIVRRDGGAAVALDGKDPAAPVLLLGTSFAEENGLRAISLLLGRPVRGVLVRGVAGLAPLREALAELRHGTRAKVVVWEMVERGFFAPEWRDPRL